MKTTKKNTVNQRKIIQQKLNRLSSLREPYPPSGWVKAIRGSLGLSIRQLANRMGVSHGSISQLEEREPKRRVTLEILDAAAKAMDCKVVYAIVPIDDGASLNDIIQKRAINTATEILNQVEHTMRLESQGSAKDVSKAEIFRIAQDLMENGDNVIWDTKDKKRNKK